jgi:hypothetical protein
MFKRIEQMNGNEFRSVVRKYMELRHINGFKDLLSDKMLGSFPTFKKKWDSPEFFTIYEIDYLIRRLNVRSCDRAVLKGESDKAITPFDTYITEKGEKNRA